MSPHDLDRLSAYIDRELPPGERASVELHLRECADCSRRLGDMAVIDAAVRAIPLEAPEGYFESFPGRLRGRLATARRGLRRPTWLLAAAASLLLAVLTPALLRERPFVPPPAQAPPASVAAAPAAGPTEPGDAPAPAADQFESRGATRPTEEPEPAGRLAPPTPAPPAKPPAGGEAVRDGLAAAPAARPKSARRLDQPAKAATQDASSPETVVVASPGARAEGFSKAPEPEDKAAAPPDPGPLGSPVATPPAAPPPAASGARTADLESDEGPRVRKRRQGPLGGRVAEARPALEAADASPQARYESLLDRRVTGAADARALREAWRAFARDYPDSPWGDEARVRIIEVGTQAYRLGGDHEDLSLARRDAGDYLKRDTALQTDRVRALLESLN